MSSGIKIPYTHVMEILKYSNDNDISLVNKDIYNVIYERRKETTKRELVYLFEIFKDNIMNEYLLIYMDYNIYTTILELKKFLYNYLLEINRDIQLRLCNKILKDDMHLTEINWFEETIYIDYL